ncbi:MAG: RecQ family ATP-dependent DNA helicase [Bacteroidetes bacterium]|nr:RecQ family ATP-dependent DNA helicase [Bacteroidota bacterium]
MLPKDLHILKHQTLEHFWGYTSFRNLQEEIINDVLLRKDIVALLPTGGGKSLCYQLPTLLLEGVCLVISPLLALMKDQVEQLKNNGIDAEYISSELDEFEAEEILDRCINGQVKLLYVSPERLKNPYFLQQIEVIQISFIAVDEAHCISEWGQDFRPSYQNICQFRNHVKTVPILALTATATSKVVLEITQKLDLKKPSIYKKSFKRENIKVLVNEVADKYQKIFDWLQFNTHSGIIYARTRKETEELTRFLQSKGLKNCDFYHAGLSAKDKSKKQKAWLQSNHLVLIATNAFGMGIDKDNVRFVIHLTVPSSLENYYQEIGRAGRDGEESLALMLWNKPELNNFDDILKNSIPNQKEFEKIGIYLYSIFNIAANEWSEDFYQLNLQKLQNLTKSSRAKIRNVLQFLHNQEIIYLNEMKSLSTLELKIQIEDIESLPKKDAYFIELLFRTLPGISTHKVHFSETAISQKLTIDPLLIKERLRELHQAKYLNFIDGDQLSIRFLEHRNDRAIQGKYYHLFKQIQKNKLQKWEEMKYFVQNEDFCKMSMILSYFGERNLKNCNQCSVCSHNSFQFSKPSVSSLIVQYLTLKPATADEITFQLNYYGKEEILENLIVLLDEEKIRMLDFRTYTIA